MFGSLPICRVCLKTSLEYIDFDTPFEAESKQQSESDLTYLDCFLACTRLEIELNENSPQSLCSACGLELKIAYEFLRKAESADQTLRRHAADSKLVKLEDEGKSGTAIAYDDFESDELSRQNAFGIVCDQLEQQGEGQPDDEKNFICTICGDQFFSQFVLNIHVNRFHPNNDAEEAKISVGKIECHICDDVVPLSKLNNHMQMHEDEENMNDETTVNNEQLIDVGDEADFETLDINGDSLNSQSPRSELPEEDTTTAEDYEQQSGEDEKEDTNSKLDADYQDRKFTLIEKILTSEEKARAIKPSYKRCTVCSRHVRSASFQTHMNIHNGIRQFICSHCPENFFSKRSLQTHIKTAHKDQIKSVCRVCREPVDASNMKSHIQEAHFRIVKCTKCEYQGQEIKMKEHMKRRHAESRDFLCNICSKTFCTLGVLNAHLKYHERKESNIKSDACEICGKVFSTNHYLKSHMLTHQDERQKFQCKHCDKTYHSKAALDNHMRMHKGDTIKCLLCSKEFARQYELNVHMRFHTKDYPFECEVCQKKFAIKGHLRTHMWRHQGLKLQCEECGKLFTSTKALQEHSFCHSEMPFPCPFCPKAYPSKPKFKVHLKTAHMVEFSNDELQKMSKFPLPKRSRSKKFTLVQADTVMKEVEVHTKEDEDEQT